MAESNKSNAKISSDESKPTFLHNFFGQNLSPMVKSAAGDDMSPAVSDLGSEKQVIKHLDGIPFYGRGTGSDLTGSEMSNKSSGDKRSISDSGFMSSSRDGLQHIRAESSEGLHLMKMLRNAETERPMRPHNETMLFGKDHLRPTSTPHLLGLPSGCRTDPSGLRRDRVNVGPTRMGQIGIHTHVNRYMDGSVGPSGVSQSAADEGSRTGIKRSGIFYDKVPSWLLLSGNIKNFDKINSEPESAASASRHGSAPGGQQMTIFYGGQAHVFDDVHPNKADMIMAVAGSNGGSWSTSYAKSATPITGDISKPNESGAASKNVTPGELKRTLSTARGSYTGYQLSVLPGGHQEDNIKNVEHGENDGKTGTVQNRNL